MSKESSEVKKPSVTIYTDGACKGNPGIGGWGALLTFGEHSKRIFGGEPETTNNRMELRATIEGLKTLKKSCNVTIYTDSKYVMKGITEWIVSWKKNGWKGSNKKPIANQDLWKELDKLIKEYKINWCWVKGHSGNVGNEIADTLANQGVALIQKKIEVKEKVSSTSV